MLDDEATVICPWCHQAQLLVVDPQSVGRLDQDCDVCCRPWAVHVSRDEEGRLSVWVERA